MTQKEIQAKRREWYRSAVDLLGWWLVRQMMSAADHRGALNDSLDVARMAGHFGRLASGQGDWQPIATAPKDGTAVLVWSAGVGLVEICQYSCEIGNCSAAGCIHIGPQKTTQRTGKRYRSLRADEGR